MPKPPKKKRYQQDRLLINWKKDAFVLTARELCPLIAVEWIRSPQETKEEFIGRRMRELLPGATKIVLGERRTLEDLEQHIRDTQNRPLTFHLFADRADKLPRYDEFHPLSHQVRSAYLQVTGQIIVREDFPSFIVKRRLREVDYCCEYCGRDLHRVNYEADHRIPVSRGGRGNYENLAICCWECNAQKGDMTDKEWVEELSQRQEHGRGRKL